MTSTDLERRLTDLATRVEFPPTPLLRGAVLDASALSERRRPAWQTLAIVIAVIVVLGAAVAAVSFGVGGLRITRGTGSLPPLPSDVVAARGIGTRTTLGAAVATLGFVPRLPSSELGAPDDVYLADPPSGGALSLVWRDASGAGMLMLTQFRADIGPEVFEKMALDGTTVERTRVGGAPAWWVGDGAHPFFYRDAQGAMVDGTLRLAASTLIWEADGITSRVEGAGTLPEAVRIASSLR